MKNILALLVAFLIFPPAQAIDGYSVDVGEGNETKMVKIAVQESWMNDCALLRDNYLESYWEISAADIEGRKYRDAAGQKRSLIDFGFTPVLRYRGASKPGLFIELGVGANYFTEKYNNNGRQLASNFEFGDHVGLGYLFSNQIELTLKFQHFSDAGIREPNSGLNMGVIKIAYPF
jgi:hypothetical protein